MGSILLVEADRDTTDHWGGVLQAVGHEVVLTDALRDVLPLIREGGIDVVVLDSNAPRALVELARAIETVEDAPPLVLVSGSPDAPEASARMGAAVFLAKPCDPEDLLAAVGRIAGHVRPVLVVSDDPSDARPNTFE